jgi:rod shape-determining protein MreB
VLQVESGYTFSDQPWLAITESKDKKKIVGYGKQALTMVNMPNINVINGFKHPRTIIADFNAASLTMTYFVKQACKYRNKFIHPSPLIIIHLIDEWEGGLTLVEVRALKELCLMAGGRAVYCWQGLELSNEELKTLAFPSSKGKLLD